MSATTIPSQLWQDELTLDPRFYQPAPVNERSKTNETINESGRGKGDSEAAHRNRKKNRSSDHPAAQPTGADGGDFIMAQDAVAVGWNPAVHLDYHHQPVGPVGSQFESLPHLPPSASVPADGRFRSPDEYPRQVDDADLHDRPDLTTRDSGEDNEWIVVPR